jgi:hypothetical protein
MESAETPISPTRPGVMARSLKRERLHAEDAIEQGGDWCTADSLRSRTYGDAVKSTIT